jgi:hypothetical protein
MASFITYENILEKNGFNAYNYPDVIILEVVCLKMQISISIYLPDVNNDRKFPK